MLSDIIVSDIIKSVSGNCNAFFAGPIRRCGCGVAVSNALECVREAADYIAGSNDEDGVAMFLAGRVPEGNG